MPLVNIPPGFKPTYEALYHFVDLMAGEDFVVSRPDAPKQSAEERLNMLRAFRRSDRDKARNILEGKDMLARRDD